MSENESNNPHQLVIDALEIHRQRRRADPNLGKAAVVIDLDACGLDARTRTINAVKATGRHYVISEFSRPGELATLPTDNPKVWQNFLVTNGLLKKYPDMDWDAVRKDFSANYWREPGNDPYLHLRTDQFAAGLWEYTKVVRAHDAEVVFLSGRSERHRLHSEHTLNAGGAGPYRLLIKPDQGEVDTAQNKVDNLLAVSDQTAPEPLVPVVIIDDLTENREAVKAAFPDIIAIHMALPGYAADHLPGQRPADGAPVVSDFLGGVSRPKHTGRLSYLTSMSKVLFGVENSPPLARGAEISGGEMENHLLSLVRRSLREARDVGAAHADRGDLADSVHRVLTHKMFRRGPRTNFEVGEFRAQLAALGIGYGSDVAIPAGIIGFPIKFEGLKAKGTQPDLAEFGGLLRLKQIATAVREVYPDGMRIEILTDGTHFRSRDDSLVDSYLDQLERYRALIDPEGDLVIEDFDAAVARHLKDPGLPTRRASSKIEIQRALQEKLAGFDVATDGLAAVVAVDARWPIDKADSQDRLLENQALPFQIFFTSLVHSVPVEADPEEIYRDLYRINDTRVPNYLTRERKRVLAEAWAGTIETLAAHAADRVVGYDQLAAHLIKLRSPATRKGSFGVGYLGGENGVPWHRTGALVDGNVSGDMGFELMRNGFSPVYSDVLSPGPGAKQRQPFFMVPAAALNAGTVDRQLLSGMRMRKK